MTKCKAHPKYKAKLKPRTDCADCWETYLYKKYCCAWMRYFVENKCDIHEREDCGDCLLHYSEQHKKFGILIHDGGSSFMTINYCPWCGTTLGKGDPVRMINV